MNVLIINTFYWGGGAEKIARQLYNGLNNYEGINCFFLAGRESKQVQTDETIYHNGSIPQAVNHILCHIKYDQRERDWFSVKAIIRIIRKKKIDLVHFHNIHGNYMGIRDIGEISKHCKVVWTLHDMWAITGHCAYSCQCDKWIMDSCKNCSNLQLYPALRMDRAEHIYRTKKKAFVNKNINFVVPSKWLMKQCDQSFLAEESKVLIHNGVDITSFYPCDKKMMREKYDISQDKLVLLFAANNIDSFYKGAEILEDALCRVEKKDEYELVIVGNARSFLLEKDYICHYMGYIQSDEIMNELYGLADVFIIPSRAENFPCTVIESMAAGTPVIASNVGGIAEQIDEETGWLFNVEGVDQLVKIIEGLINNRDKLCAMKINCRKKVEAFFSEQKMFREYQKLYDAIVNGCV